MRDKIKAIVDGLPNREFQPGARVVKIGYKWVTWTDRGQIEKAPLNLFYKALAEHINIYYLLRG